MKTVSIPWKDKSYECETYEAEDLPKILEVFFFWKTTALLAEKTETKNSPLPEKFSARFCCFTCGLAYKKPGSGPDAFRFDNENKARAVELKATITTTGFTDIKRDQNFDELYWLSFADHNALRYEVYKFQKREIDFFVQRSKTNRDRATMNLKNVADHFKVKPVQTGCIGVIIDKQRQPTKPRKLSGL